MRSEEFAERIVAMQETLYRVSYSMLPQAADREDAVQACIEKAWQKRDSLKEERYLQTWVIRILINECYQLLRKRRREVPYEEIAGREAPPDANLYLHDLFLALDMRHRLPAVLYYMEEYTSKEIAAILRVPEGTVKSRLHKARALMRSEISRQEVHQG